MASIHLIFLVFSVLTLIGAVISWNRKQIGGIGRPS